VSPARPWRFGLFWQICLYGVALLVAVVLAASLLGRVSSSGDSLSDLSRDLATEIEALGPRPIDSAVLECLLRHPQAQVATVYDRDGRLIASTATPPLPHSPADELPARAHRRVFPEEPPWRVVTVLEDRGQLIVGSGNSFRADAAQIFGALLAAVACIVMLVSLPMARAIAAPLGRLIHAVRALGEGELSARSQVKTHGEVGELARAFDDMAERIQALVRAERELVANVSHELRTPMARMRVALDLVEVQGAGRALRSLEEIAIDLRELERLVEDLLTVSRLDLHARAPSRGLPLLRRERAELSSVLRACAARFHERFPDRALRVELEPGLGTLDADVGLLSRAFDNLLDNAHKYSRAEITLRAGCAGARACVSVEDCGEGVAAEDLPLLFTPFFRTDRSRTRMSGGVGLGLSLTRRIVEAHGGQVWLESQLGRGTTVTVELPLAALSEGPSAADPGQATS
jgi:signal transduction histidine kinase